MGSSFILLGVGWDAFSRIIVGTFFARKVSDPIIGTGERRRETAVSVSACQQKKVSFQGRGGGMTLCWVGFCGRVKSASFRFGT